MNTLQYTGQPPQQRITWAQMSSVPMWSRPAVKETGPRRSSSSFKKPQRVSGKAGTRTRVSWDLALRQVSQVTQPTVGRGSEQSFPPQGPGWATASHSPGHSVTNPDEEVVGTPGCPPSSPLLLPSLTEPCVCPAAAGSDLLGLPGVKPLLAPQPLLQILF